MSWLDLGLLALTVLAVFGPGAALVKVGLRRGRLETLAIAPAVTVALCYLAAVITAPLGLSWGPPAVLAVTVAGTLVPWLVRRRRGASAAAGARSSLLRFPSVRFSVPREFWLPAAGVVAGVALGSVTFLRGFGRLAVLPQEHDMVAHTLLAARIERTGEAAPWQSNPVDLLTGDPAGFYPNGVHMLASLAAPGPVQTVAAVNAVTLVLFAIVVPVGMAALAGLLTPPAIRPVAMGGAALISVVSYRPIFAYLHDGGILANAAALALVPSVVFAAVLAARSGRAGGYTTVGLGLVGATVVHPTAALTIAVTAAAWILSGLLAQVRDPRATLVTVARLAAAGMLAVLALLPFLIEASSTAAFVASFPRRTGPVSLGGALGQSLSFQYGGYYDPAGLLAQALLAAVSLLGVAACLYYRSNLPLVVTYGVWLVIGVVWLIKPGFPLISTLGGFYYNNYARLSGGLWLMQWLTAAVALGYAAALVASGLRHLTARARRPGVVGAQIDTYTGALSLLLFLVLVTPYAWVNVITLQQRYREPEFNRVDADDLAAGRFLAERVRPGQRVMNNANDGSTYAYVYFGVPLVETSTLASPYAPYTTELLLHFDDLERDPDVRELVCELDIAWVMADDDAPAIGAPEDVTPLGDDGFYTTPGGFRHLDDLETVKEAYTHGSVTVYEVDLTALGC